MHRRLILHFRRSKDFPFDRVIMAQVQFVSGGSATFSFRRLPARRPVAAGVGPEVQKAVLISLRAR